MKKQTRILKLGAETLRHLTLDHLPRVQGAAANASRGADCTDTCGSCTTCPTDVNCISKGCETVATCHPCGIRW